MGDSVEHPDHYNEHPSGVECIDIVEHMGFNLGNVVKYAWRADLKHDDSIEDLRKAAFYLEREIARRSGEVKGKAYLKGFEDGVAATTAQDSINNAFYRGIRVAGTDAETVVEWGNPKPPTDETRAEAIRDLIDDDVVQVGLTDPYGAFAGRNLEAMNLVADNMRRAALHDQRGVFRPQTFLAEMTEADLTEEQKQKVAEEMKKPEWPAPTHRKNPDGSVTEIATGNVVGHVSGQPIKIESISWLDDHDWQRCRADTMRMYAVPPEQQP